MILLTNNLTTVNIQNLQSSEIIDAIELSTQAGQTSENAYFRVGFDSDPYDDPYESELNVVAYTTDPNLSVSLDSARGFSPAVQQQVKAGKVGSTIFVKLSADLDATEGTRQSSIIVNDRTLTVNYFVASADKGDTENSPMRFAGDNTFDVLDQIDEQGEALELVRYDPLPKPGPVPKGKLVPFQSFKNQNVVEWVNPNNAQVGWTKKTYYAKGFVGDRDLLQNLRYENPLALVHGDVEQIILPPTFPGFDPTPNHVTEFFSQISPTQKGYQRTQWTVRRHDGEYALINIRKQKYYRGQFLFFHADLQRVNYPGASSSQGFLPWNQVYNEDGKIIDYVPGFSREDVENPYCDYQSDTSNSPAAGDTSNVVIEDTSSVVIPDPEPEPEAPEPVSATHNATSGATEITFSLPLDPTSSLTASTFTGCNGAKEIVGSGTGTASGSTASFTMNQNFFTDCVTTTISYDGSDALLRGNDGTPVEAISDFPLTIT